MRSVLFAAAAFPVLSAAPAPAQEERESSVTTIVIGDRFALSTACYENAKSGEGGAAMLEPCNRSLETEALTDRRRAVVYANRDVIQYNSGAYEAAALDFTASLDLGVFLPARLLVNRGLAYEALRHDALARADYRRALELSLHNATARRRLEELDKPFYERSRLPTKVTAEVPPADDEGEGDS